MGAKASVTVGFRPVQPLSASTTLPEYLDAYSSDRLSVGDARSREETDDDEDDEEEDKKDKGDDEEEDGGGYSVRVYPFVSVLKDETRGLYHRC